MLLCQFTLYESEWAWFMVAGIAVLIEVHCTVISNAHH